MKKILIIAALAVTLAGCMGCARNNCSDAEWLSSSSCK